MAKEKTSIWIDKLSKDGKDAMHSFLMFFNTGKHEDKKIVLNPTDTETLSVIVGRLQKQNSKEKINKAIQDFNSNKGTNLKEIA